MKKREWEEKENTKGRDAEGKDEKVKRQKRGAQGNGKMVVTVDHPISSLPVLYIFLLRPFVIRKLPLWFSSACMPCSITVLFLSS